MKFTSRSKARSGARRNFVSGQPVEIETFEARLLLTTIPNILTPTGTITDPTPEISWAAVDNAVSYDLWVASLETYDVILVERGIAGTSFTPDSELSLGGLRIWVRGNFEDGTSTPWSPSKDVLLASKPVVTGPTGVGAIPLNSDTTPTITWTSANDARRFQIWVTDVTTGLPRQYFVNNLTPVLDDNGDPVLDLSGLPVREEVRSFTIPETDALELGRYRVWVQSTDGSGRLSKWSDVYQFNVGPQPENLNPSAPTFQVKPLLTWNAVNRATHYEVFVARQPFGQPIAPGSTYTPIYRLTVSTNSWQIPDTLADGGYVFWVRAIARPTTGPVVYGVWSSPTQFSTLVPPTITGPAIIGGVVTEGRPVIEWTRIDGAARYEVLVRKFDTRPSFLEDYSSTTTYQFAETIPAGDYAVWVRAIDTRGNFAAWSDVYAFTATGGRPVLNSPAPGEVTLFPEFSWLEVNDADVTGYQLWVSHIGVDFTFINVDVTGNSFTATNPLDDGNYRVWVRAVYADGSTGAWSIPVDFVGGIAAIESGSNNVETLLTSLEIELAPAAVATGLSWTPDDAHNADDAEEVYVAISEPPVMESVAADSQLLESALPQDLLTRIAEQCIDSEWWESAEKSS